MSSLPDFCLNCERVSGESYLCSKPRGESSSPAGPPLITPLIKQQRAEVAIVVEALAHAAPVPAGALTFVVIDAVKVGPPARTGFRSGVGERLEHVEGDEHLRRPASDGRT